MISTQDVIESVANHIGVAAKQINTKSPVIEITPDSFALVELALGLQDDFGVELHQEDVEQKTTVRDLAELIIAKSQSAVAESV